MNDWSRRVKYDSASKERTASGRVAFSKASRKVISNKGACGVDSMDVSALRDYSRGSSSKQPRRC